MRKSTKKGFTIVELVIVVAVIAILAAVLIPTFTGIVNKARESSDIQLVRNLNTALATDKVLNGEHKTMKDAINAAYEGGYVIEKLAASAKGNKLLWDSANGLFCYYDDDAKGDKYVYAPEAELTMENPADYQYWEITDEVIPLDEQKFSIYYNGADIDTYDVKVGFDAGNAKIGTINYKKNSDPQTVVIRTNSASTVLTINAETDTVYHYGPVGTVDITEIDMACYYENGSAAYVKIAAGKVVATAGKIEVLFVNATDATTVAVEKVSGAVAKSYATADVATELGASFTVADKTVADAAGKEAVDFALEEERKDEFNENNYWIGAAAESFAGGDGSAANPYLISTAQQLARLAYVMHGSQYAEYQNKHYKLTADIDLSGKCWVPIVTSARGKDLNKYFTGTFDGNNKTITGLNSVGLSMSFIKTMANDSTPVDGAEYVYGLFGGIDGATIKNVNLTEVNIQVGMGTTKDDGTAYLADSVGALVGYATGNIVVENCHTLSGVVQGYDGISGIIGKYHDAANQYSMSVSNCSNAAVINAVRRAAGIVANIRGNQENISVTNCSNSGAITSGFAADVDPKGDSSNYYCAYGIAVVNRNWYNSDGKTYGTGANNWDKFVYDASPSFAECENTGVITNNFGHYTGGIAGGQN